MKKFALALSTALLLGSLTTPAAAYVIDRQNLVPAAEEKELADALSHLRPHRIEVHFTNQKPIDTVAEAAQTFRRLGLGDKDGVIVIAIQAGQIGVNLGGDFTRAGISKDDLNQRIYSDYVPHAQKGHYALGAASLARNLTNAIDKSTPPAAPKQPKNQTQASPASAFVIDRQNLVPAAEEKKLANALSHLGPHRFKVLFVSQTPGTPSAEAEQTFRRLGLGDKDGVIVVATQAKKVGVYVGPGLTRRGVSEQVVSQHIKSDFLPHAKKGEFALGASTLAQGLSAAGAHAPGARTSPPPAPKRSVLKETTGGDGIGALIFLLLFVVGPIGGMIALKRWETNSKLGPLRNRFDALREPHETIMTGTLKLAEIETLTQFQKSTVQRSYQQLEKEAQRALKRIHTFNGTFEQTKKAIKTRKVKEATRLLPELEYETVVLGVDVAASLTALAQLESGGLTSEQALVAATLPERVQKHSRYLAEVHSAYVRATELARPYKLTPSPQLKQAVAEANQLLTQCPIDPEGAERWLADAENALFRFTAEITAANRVVLAKINALPDFRRRHYHHHDHGHHHHHSNLILNLPNSGAGFGSSHSGSEDEPGSQGDGSWETSNAEGSSAVDKW